MDKDGDGSRLQFSFALLYVSSVNGRAAFLAFIGGAWSGCCPEDRKLLILRQHGVSISFRFESLYVAHV